jgi:hypothetical protein
LVWTTKSVPRTPMAAIGVLSRNRDLSVAVACPEIERLVPCSTLRRTSLVAGRSAS